MAACCSGAGLVPKDLALNSFVSKKACIQDLKVGHLCADEIDTYCCTAIVTADPKTQTSEFLNGALPVAKPMQSPLTIDSGLFLQKSVFAQFSKVLVDQDDLWDQTQYAFIIKEAGQYQITYEATFGIIPIPTAPVDDPADMVWPSAYSCVISVRNADDTPKSVGAQPGGVGGDIRSGQPLTIVPIPVGSGGNPPYLVYGIVPVLGSAIVDLEEGDKVRLTIKCAYQGTSTVSGVPALLGLIHTQILNDDDVTYSDIILRASYFAINKLSNKVLQ